MTNKLVFTSFIVAAGFSILISGCAKEDSSSAKSDAIGDKTTYSYIVNGKSYPITVQEQKKDSFVIVSEVNNTLAEVLNCETSVLLQDPFNKKTYYAFKSEEESNATNAEILRKLNQYELKNQTTKANNNLKTLRVGKLKAYKERYFITPIIDMDITEQKLFNLESYQNDEISSYKVWSNTYGPQNGTRFAIKFYENQNGKGHWFKAYSDFESDTPNTTDKTCWEEDNLHGLVMSVNWTSRKYWGDRVSSIQFILE